MSLPAVLVQRHTDCASQGALRLMATVHHSNRLHLATPIQGRDISYSIEQCSADQPKDCQCGSTEIGSASHADHMAWSCCCSATTLVTSTSVLSITSPYPLAPPHSQKSCCSTVQLKLLFGILAGVSHTLARVAGRKLFQARQEGKLIKAGC